MAGGGVLGWLREFPWDNGERTRREERGEQRLGTIKTAGKRRGREEQKDKKQKLGGPRREKWRSRTGEFEGGSPRQRG